MNQARFDLQDEIDAEVLRAEEVSATIESIWGLDPAWARQKLIDDRNSTAEGQDWRWASLGCWMKWGETTHNYGYTKINLRNTVRPGTTEKINVQPFRHQLAVVASGYGQNLLRTSPVSGNDEVSHLCHNQQCFNPEHVIVESQELNKARRSCVGAFVTKCKASGTVFHPCLHGASENFVDCILPRVDLEGGKYYRNSPNGPV